MEPFQLATPTSLPPTAGFSHVATVPLTGRLVWTSGQVPIHPDGSAPPAYDWAAQTRLVMENLTTALNAGGATWADVFKLTIFVVSTDELATVRAVRDEFVNTANPPTSSLIQVAGLFRPDILIEIEAIAVVAE